MKDEEVVATFFDDDAKGQSLSTDIDDEDWDGMLED